MFCNVLLETNIIPTSPYLRNNSDKLAWQVLGGRVDRLKAEASGSSSAGQLMGMNGK